MKGQTEYNTVGIRRSCKWEYLSDIIRRRRFKRGAEVGTGTGRTAFEILKANPRLHLIEVVYYPGPEMLEGLRYCECQKAKEKWEEHIEKFLDRVTILAMPSHEAAPHVKDMSLDFVFIDADHSYEECLRDIKLWYPKVRRGGLVCGDDYEHPDFPGVRRAVDEMFSEVEQPTENVWAIWKKK